MHAVVLTEPGAVTLESLDTPEPGDNALVKIETVGICGTDIKIIKGDIPVSCPRILGHEIIGRIVQQSPNGSMNMGTRVLVNPSASCGTCNLCKSNRDYLCKTGTLLGRDIDGGFVSYMAVDERRLHVISESLSAKEVALLQVLGTCVHAQSLVDTSDLSSAVILGLGVSGFLHLQLLHAQGVKNIVCVTRAKWKRDLALSMGAQEVLTPDEAGDYLDQLTNNERADLVIECAGSPSSLNQAFDLAGIGGTVLIFGIISGTPAINTYPWYYKELKIINSRAAGPNDYDRAIELASSGLLKLEPLVTSQFSLTDVNRAIEACSDPLQLKIALDVTE